MKRGKKKKSIKCKIRASYSKTSYTFTRDLCLYIYIYMLLVWNFHVYLWIWISFLFYRNHYLWSGCTFSYGISQKNLSLCVWIFSCMGLLGGKPYYVQKFPTSYLALLLLAWLCIFISLHIFIPSLRMVSEISP